MAAEQPNAAGKIHGLSCIGHSHKRRLRENLFTCYVGELLFFMEIGSFNLRKSRAILIQSLLATIILAGVACSDRKKIDRQAQLKTMLQGFFNAPTVPGQTGGVWVAEQNSVSELIEKKFLSSYVAKPDEKQAGEIRERMKSLRIFFRVQKDKVQMLTVVADSFGMSAGELTARPPQEAGVQSYDAVLRGKSGPLRAAFRLRPAKTGDKLEYDEAGFVLTAVRETRSVDQSVAHYMTEMSAATGLPQY